MPRHSVSRSELFIPSTWFRPHTTQDLARSGWNDRPVLVFPPNLNRTILAGFDLHALTGGGWATMRREILFTNPANGVGNVAWSGASAELDVTDQGPVVANAGPLVVVAAPPGFVGQVIGVVNLDNEAVGSKLIHSMYVQRAGTEATDTLENDVSFLGVRLVKMT